MILFFLFFYFFHQLALPVTVHLDTGLVYASLHVFLFLNEVSQVIPSLVKGLTDESD